MVFNGSDSHWIAYELEYQQSYVFQVRARNEKGWGPLSPNSTMLDYLPYEKRGPNELTLILAASFGTVMVFIIIAAVLLGLGRYQLEIKVIY